MSDFDLQLGRWEKISTIVIGVLGLLATAYVTFTVIIPGDMRDRLKDCKEKQAEATRLIGDNPEMNTEGLVSSLNTSCVQDNEASRRFLANEQSSAQLAAQAAQDTRKEQSIEQKVSDDEAKISGFVSLGPDADYQRSNFRDLGNNEKAVKFIENLNVGSILQARWSVNLRENKENTETGNNKSLLVIRDEECVRLEEKPTDTTRGSWWVKVSLTSCPSDGA